MKDRKIRKRVMSVYSVPLYCTCRMAKDGEMIECSSCNEWFHVSCVKVSEAALTTPDESWFCLDCK